MLAIYCEFPVVKTYYNKTVFYAFRLNYFAKAKYNPSQSSRQPKYYVKPIDFSK